MCCYTLSLILRTMSKINGLVPATPRRWPSQSSYLVDEDTGSTLCGYLILSHQITNSIKLQSHGRNETRMAPTLCIRCGEALEGGCDPKDELSELDALLERLRLKRYEMKRKITMLDSAALYALKLGEPTSCIGSCYDWCRLTTM